MNLKNLKYRVLPIYNFGNSINLDFKFIADIKLLYFIFNLSFLLNKKYERNEKLKSALPEGVKVNDAVLEGNVATIDLSKEFIDNHTGGEKEENATIYSIVDTLTELNEVNGVKILVEGKEDAEFKNGKTALKDVFVKSSK